MSSRNSRKPRTTRTAARSRSRPGRRSNRAGPPDADEQAKQALSDRAKADPGAGSEGQEEKPLEFLNRDLGWLEFNSRVLAQALDRRTPLLERIRFLGIFTSNLDEFFMKRIGLLRRQVRVGVQRRAGGLTPVQTLASVRRRVGELLERQARGFHDEIIPELKRNGIEILPWRDLNSNERAFADAHFKQNVFPVLTPLAVDPGLPFPFISNLSTSLGVTLRHPERDERLFARVKVPRIFPQWLKLPSEPGVSTVRFVSLTELIVHNLKGLFPDMEILDVMPFRITRNAEIERDEEEAEDLLEMVAEELKQRRFAEVVRLETGPEPDPWMRRVLMDELDLTDAEVFEAPSLLDFTDLKTLVELARPELKFDSWNPLVPPRLMDDRESIFDIIRQGDLLVHHPYESFGASVERFIRHAVDDKNVLAIKMTLYRTGDDSPFIPLLIRAAERGKQVVVLIELKARFDEERNIHWAQELEDAGVHVVYGVVGLKTHAKTALVIRREDQLLRCYAHLGTGNYHRETSKLYTDFGLFTCQPDLTEDVVELFHFLTGRSLKRNYKKLLVAPIGMRETILKLIRREADFARAGRPARIIMKCNSLEEVSLCRALYEASEAGVEIDLIVRGFSCLRPGVRGLSSRIRLISIIGRFLEHSRVLFFLNGQSEPVKGDFYIGSADMMYRNLLARVETMAPIEDPTARTILWESFDIMLNDRRLAWEMQSDGTYAQYQPKTKEQETGTHERLMQVYKAHHRRWLEQEGEAGESDAGEEPKAT